MPRLYRPGARPAARRRAPVPTAGAVVLTAAWLAPPAAPASAQERELTLDAIFGPAGRVDFDGGPPRDLEWLDDRHYLQPAGRSAAPAGPPLNSPWWNPASHRER